MNLEGKTAIVTGGSGGIGGEIAKGLASDGAKVLLTYSSNAEQAEVIASGIKEKGGNAEIYKCDLTSDLSIKELFETAKTRLGAIDIVVNNAGVAVLTPFAELNADHYEQIFSVNVRAVALSMHYTMSYIAQGGRIINVSSSTVKRPFAGLALYAASKAAVNTLTEIGALEFGHLEVTVNAVMPGPTVPGMFERMPPEMHQTEAQRSPFKRLGRAEDIAEVVCFLASDAAKWITGQIICVDGGAYL